LAVAGAFGISGAIASGRRSLPLLRGLNSLAFNSGGFTIDDGILNGRDRLSRGGAGQRTYSEPNLGRAMPQYYTLEEAASKLKMSPDELREMAKQKKVRAFQDRGSWRFRTQEIDEMARERGLGSDPELQPGEAVKSPPRPRPSKLGPKSPPPDEE